MKGEKLAVDSNGNMRNHFKLCSLFDGSGGFCLAGLMNGITPVSCSEVEPYPIAVTKSRFPNIRHYGDVSTIYGYDLEPVDVITFGSPCQSMSVAGKREGLKHVDAGDEETTRSGLFYEAIRIIKEMRAATNNRYPTFAVWENVEGSLTSSKGEDFYHVIESFAKISDPSISIPRPEKNKWLRAGEIMGDNFSIAWRTLDAEYWGVAQRRRRIYLVADFAGRRAGKILFERESVSRYTPQSGKTWEGFASDAERSVGTADNDTILDTPKTLKIRSGCEGGGKGALIQDNKSATLSCNNDQTLFEPIANKSNNVPIETGGGGSYSGFNDWKK